MFREWCKANSGGNLLRPKDPEPDKNAVKAFATLPDGKPGDTVQPIEASTGLVIEGVSVTYRPRKLVIES